MAYRCTMVNLGQTGVMCSFWLQNSEDMALINIYPREKCVNVTNKFDRRLGIFQTPEKYVID